MSATIPEGGDVTVVHLPAVLDLTAASALKSDLLAALAGGAGIVVDAGDVQRVTTPCLQVLVSAFKTVEQTEGVSIRLQNISPVFAETAGLLSLKPALSIEEA